MLTPAMRKLLTFIEAEQARTGGVSPTLREMADHMGVRAISYVFKLTKALEERGFIKRLPKKARAIEVLRSWPVSEGV